MANSTCQGLGIDVAGTLSLTPLNVLSKMGELLLLPTLLHAAPVHPYPFCVCVKPVVARSLPDREILIKVRWWWLSFVMWPRSL